MQKIKKLLIYDEPISGLTKKYWNEPFVRDAISFIVSEAFFFV